jgi:hypothetical protein
VYEKAVYLTASSIFQTSMRYLHYPKEVQYDENDSDNDQNVNPTACFREAWIYVPTQKAKQPQDY